MNNDHFNIEKIEEIKRCAVLTQIDIFAILNGVPSDNTEALAYEIIYGTCDTVIGFKAINPTSLERDEHGNWHQYKRNSIMRRYLFKHQILTNF